MRVEKIQEYLTEQEVDALLINSPTNRRYISGFTGSFGSVLITKDKAIFITDFRYIAQAAIEAEGFEVVENRNLLEEVYKQLQKEGITTLAFEEAHTSYLNYQQLCRYENIKLVPVLGVVEEMRMIKSEAEIEKIKTAARISDKAFERILKDIKLGVTEREIGNKLEFYMREEGATSASFDMIIASGHRSALPHGIASSKKIEQGDFITLDFGALYEGYCSDMTRTVVVGEPNEQLKEIYDIVNDALSIGLNHAKAGESCAGVDAVIRDFITDKGYGEQFGHGAGHSFGLEIHESPYFSTVSDEVLKENMVMTIEPGIYIPGLGGVRIEDDVVITKSGCDIITKSTKELLKL